MASPKHPKTPDVVRLSLWQIKVSAVFNHWERQTYFDSFISCDNAKQEKRLLAEAECQARDLRARERVYKKQIHEQNNELKKLKQERNRLKADNTNKDSELEREWFEVGMR